MDSQLQQLDALHGEMDTCIILMRLSGRPSMLDGITVSNEGAMDIIKDVAKKLLDLIYRSFERFLTVMTSGRNQAENRIISARKLLARIDDLPAMSSKAIIEINDAQYLTATGDVPNSSDILKGIKKLRDVFFTEAIDNMEYSVRLIDKVFPKTDQLLNRFSTLSSPEILFLTQGIASDVYQLRKKYLSSPHLKSTSTPHIYSTGSLLGMMEIEYKAEPVTESDLKTSNYQLTAALDAIITTRGNLISSGDYDTAPHKVLAVPGKEQRVILEECIKVLNVAIQFHIRYYKRIVQYRNKIKQYRNSYNALGRDDQNDERKVYLRKISKVLHSLNRWIYSPAIPMLGHNLKVTNAIIQYCMRSQSALHKQG